MFRNYIKFLFIFLFIFLASATLAEDLNSNLDENYSKRTRKSSRIFLDKETIAKGYTVKSSDDVLKLSLIPGILSEDTEILIEEIFDDEIALPWNLKKESSILQFEFKNKLAYDNHKPFYIQFSYDQLGSNLKQVFFYDKNFNAWRPLPTWDFPKEKFVRSLIHLPFARIAIFSYPEILSTGKASWYKYKNGNFSASTDFPKGSLIRVHNLDNKKFVDVVINDFGPDRSVFSDRILDLDYEAFKKIADKRDGLINILIEPLKVSNGVFNSNILINRFSFAEPQIESASAILLRESDMSIILEKNSEQAMPIASLSKIFSVYTFLNEANNKNRMEEIVKYSTNDEKYNYQYFPKWQIAQISLNDGDSLSIRDLLYSAMVRSANNVVESLVRLSGLSRDDFIKKINSWAKENGANSVKINEPTGLDKNNIASARDLAFLSVKIFNEELIKDSSISKSYRFVTRNDNSLKLRYNSSDLVLNNNYKNFKIIGSKTGYLDSSGYCLITRAEINGEKFIAVILNASSRENSFRETLDLFNYAFYKTKN